MTRKAWELRQSAIRQLAGAGMGERNAGLLLDRLHRFEAAMSRCAEGMCSGLPTPPGYIDWDRRDLANRAYMCRCDREFGRKASAARKVAAEAGLTLSIQGDPRGCIIRIDLPEGCSVPICW